MAGSAPLRLVPEPRLLLLLLEVNLTHLLLLLLMLLRLLGNRKELLILYIIHNFIYF